MKIREFQIFCLKDWKPGNDLTTMLLGLIGETGEVIDIFKKARRDMTSPDLKHLKEELGDVLWYICNIATLNEIDMEDVLNENIEKLIKRYKRQ